MKHRTARHREATATSIARRKAIYEELHPETAHGGDRSKSQTLRVEGDAERFTAATAKATGQSERSVQLSAERGEKVIPEVMEMIAGTKLDTGTYLDKITVIDFGRLRLTV